MEASEELVPMLDNRTEAGRKLAERLRFLTGQHPVVLGLPRGGVVTAAEVARALDAPMDVLLVGKVALPGEPELALGAVGEGAVVIANPEVVRATRTSPAAFERAVEHKREVLTARGKHYREVRELEPVAGRTVIIVDDGMATGATVRAAVHVAGARGAAEVVVAVPVASPTALRGVAGLADRAVCLQVPRHFTSVGRWYADFGPVGDDEVVALLARASFRTAGEPGATAATAAPAAPPIRRPDGGTPVH